MPNIEGNPNPIRIRSKMSKINVPLLQKTMQVILDDPKHHFQGKWHSVIQNDHGVCQTAYCFAGHAALLDGVAEPDQDDSWDVGNEHVSVYARRALGLTKVMSECLFAAQNSVKQLQMMVDRLCADRPNDNDVAIEEDLNNIMFGKGFLV